MDASDFGDTRQIGSRIGDAKVAVLQRKAEIPSEIRYRGHIIANVLLQHVVDQCAAELQGKQDNFILFPVHQ